MDITAFSLAKRFIGVKEVPGTQNNYQIMAMLDLDNKWPQLDEVPWCSAFINYIAWLLDLPRSKSLSARSWLTVGTEIKLEDAKMGNDVVVLSRGTGEQGHVGLYVSHDEYRVMIIAGNQGDAVSIAAFDIDRVLGVRRLA